MTTDQEPDDFERLANERPPGLFREFWEFLVTNKRWWLIPIVVALALFGILVVFTSQSVIAPFIYPLF